jgi:hypothetical protein
MPRGSSSTADSALYFALFCDVAGRDEQTIEAFWASIARFGQHGTGVRIITRRSTSCGVMGKNRRMVSRGACEGRLQPGIRVSG